MKRKVISVISILLVTVMTLSLCSCNSKKSLKGTWKLTSTDTIKNNMGYPMDSITFNDDGETGKWGSADFEWDTKDGMLMVDVDTGSPQDDAYIYNYDVDGDTLTLTKLNEGEAISISATYERVK